MNEYDFTAWVQLIFRWFHVFVAILWIGQTYLFNFMEKNLEAVPDKDNIHGNLWMVHGGGFYFVEKQAYPRELPKTLHWFKWESLLTWVSGFLLLIVTYYMGGLLVEPDMSFWTAVGSGIAVILLGWVIYNALLRSPLGKSDLAFAAVGLALLLIIHYGLLQVVSSRAAFIHIGAAIGTIMTANVWEYILPSQRKLIKLASEGKEADPTIAATGPMRSRHNSYMAIPMVMIMISNHYPTITYASQYSTAILGLLIVAGWGVAHMIRGR